MDECGGIRERIDRIAEVDARIDDVLEGYRVFYLDRIDRGLPVDRRSCPYTRETLADAKFARRSMLVSSFDKFERKRFIYPKDLGMISLNHARLSKVNIESFLAVQTQMQQDLRDYYAKREAGE